MNLSDGEFQLPPEQVHAVGVKALDAMKDATHTPADRRSDGFKPEKERPRQTGDVFADGGVVEERRKRSQQVSSGYSSNPTMAKAQANIDAEQQARRGTVSALLMLQSSSQVLRRDTATISIPPTPRHVRMRHGSNRPLRRPDHCPIFRRHRASRHRDKVMTQPERQGCRVSLINR